MGQRDKQTIRITAEDSLKRRLYLHAVAIGQNTQRLEVPIELAEEFRTKHLVTKTFAFYERPTGLPYYTPDDASIASAYQLATGKQTTRVDRWPIGSLTKTVVLQGKPETEQLTRLSIHGHPMWFEPLPRAARVQITGVYDAEQTLVEMIRVFIEVPLRISLHAVPDLVARELMVSAVSGGFYRLFNFALEGDTIKQSNIETLIALFTAGIIPTSDLPNLEKDEHRCVVFHA